MTSTSKFSINLTDIESVDLRVKPTTNLNEHLLIEGNTVNVLKVSIEDINMLNAFAKTGRQCKLFFLAKIIADAKSLNRALGIESLGKEVLSSLNALYVENESFARAEALGIFAPLSDIDRILTETFLRNCSNTRPKVQYLNS
jgi:hypothetical protein